MSKRALLLTDPDELTEFADDVNRIVNLLDIAGYSIRPVDACRAWIAHSNTFSAGWLDLGEDDVHIINNIKAFCEVRG